MARTEKLERLLKLTAVLLNSPKPLTAQELRSHVEGYPEADASFNRAFERDKDDLRALGIPLKTVQVQFRDPPVDGYDIAAEDYYLSDPELTPDELAAIRLAALTIQFDGTSEESALWKLGGFSEFGEAVVKQDPLSSLPTNPALIPLFGAIVDRHKVSFVYNDLERDVSPWKLDYARGRWYLIGHDHGRDDERNFRLDRIATDIALVGQPGDAAVAPAGQRARTLAAWEIGDEDPIVSQLWVSSERSAITQRMLGASALSSAEGTDGTIFDVTVRNREAFRFFVLGLGDQAEIVEPIDLRADIIGWLEALAGHS